MTNFEHQFPQNPSQAELQSLRAGDETLLDINSEMFSASEFGIDENDGRGPEVRIFGKLDIEADHPIGLAKIVNPNGSEEVYLVAKNDDDRPTVTKLPLGLTLTIGRSNPKPDDPTFLEGKQIFGKDFSDVVSRKHMEVQLTEGGLRVKSLSETNPTHVEGKKQQDPQVQKAGGKMVESVMPGLIDKVPQSTEEIIAMQNAQEAAADAARHERNEKLRAEIKDLKARNGIDEESKDSLALWKYASGTINAQEYAAKGEAQESHNQYVVAEEGNAEMSGKAIAIKAEYLRLFRALNSR